MAALGKEGKEVARYLKQLENLKSRINREIESFKQKQKNAALKALEKKAPQPLKKGIENLKKKFKF